MATTSTKWRSRETSRLPGTGTMAGVAVCIALAASLRDGAVEASVRAPASVSGLAPVVFEQPYQRKYAKRPSARTYDSPDDPGVSGVINMLAQELAHAVSKDGTDLSVEAVIRITQLMNTVLERVGMGLATWTNTRNLDMLKAAAAKDQLTSVAEVLSVEQRRHLHAPGGRIVDNTGACGLLWLRRSLAFFVELVSEAVADPDQPPASLAQPATNAYLSSVGAYHNFMTRAFFRTLLSTLPSSDKIIVALMTPLESNGAAAKRPAKQRRRRRHGRPTESTEDVPDWRTTVSEGKAFVATARKTLRIWEDLHVSYDMEDTRRF